MADKDVARCVSRSIQVGMSERVKEKTYAVVVKAKDDSSKMTSEEMKEKKMKNVGSELDIRVRAMK